MKKVLSLILITIMLLQILPVSTQAAPNSIIVLPYDMLYAQGGITSYFTKKVVVDDEVYLRLEVEPGTYGNSDLYIAVSFDGAKLFDTPYIRIDYRTDSPSPVLDFTIHHKNGENWGAGHPGLVNDGKWHSTVVDINTVNLPATVAHDKNDTSVTVHLKPWNGGTKTLEEASYFDIKFVGAFKSTSAANSFRYNKNDAIANADKYEGETGFINPDGEAKLAEFDAECDAQIEKILNTKTNVTVTGTKYYVSMNGSDNNDGLSEKTPWKTIARVNKQDFNPGDGVFFKRGDYFRADGAILRLESGVTYSAYGEGDKPVFVGSTDASDPMMWQETDVANVYKFCDKVDGAGCFVFDGGRAWGVLVSPTRNNRSVSYDSGMVHNGIDEPYKSGGEEYNGYKSLKNNLEFTNDGGYVYLYSKNGNPGEVFDTIEVVTNLSGVSGTDIEDVTFDNIKLFGYGHHGINICDIKNVVIQNCVFGWIGGSADRLGNAVQNWRNADGFKIDSCYAYQIYDCAYTTQLTTDATNEDVYIKNVVFKDTVSEYCNTGLEIWNAADKTPGTPIHYENVELYGNYVRRSGYGWSHQRPNKDGNFYYGAFFGTRPEWNNYKVYNNKFAVAYAHALLSRFISPNNAHFDKNLYILQRGKNFACTSYDYMNGGGSVTEYLYNDYYMQKFASDGIEKNGSFYYLAEDYIPEPFDYESAGDVYKPRYPFKDIDGHWAVNEIKHVIDRGWYNGISSIEFAPNAHMTRAMFLTVLARIENAELENGDVWYDGAVKWAVDNGLISEKNIRPDANITRSEMAQIVAKMIENKCANHGEGEGFSDSLSYDADVYEAILDCQAAGILKGYEDNSFRGLGNSTRAEAAAVFCRYEKFILGTTYNADALEDKGRAYIYDADELDGKLTTEAKNSDVSKYSDTGVECIRFDPTTNFGTVQINLKQSDFEGVDFYKYPYMRVKYKVTNGENQLDIGFRWYGGEQWLAYAYRPVNVMDKWCEGIVFYDDFTNNANVKLPYESRSDYYYTFKPWGNNMEIPEGSYFEIEKIGFFKDLPTAEKVDF